jgi:drug/metabolite transporter (DMT)-like permease
VLMSGEVHWRALTGATWLALFHITAGASVFAYVLWFWALSRGGIARVATFQFVQPVLVLVFAACILGETVPAGLVGAAIVIVGGIAVARRD